MDESLIRAKQLVYHLVRVTPQSDGKFAAEPIGATELRVVAATLEEADDFTGADYGEDELDRLVEQSLEQCRAEVIEVNPFGA